MADAVAIAVAVAVAVALAVALAVVKAADESCSKSRLCSPWLLLEDMFGLGAFKTGFFWRRSVIVDGATG